MHGFFMDLRLHQRVSAAVDPFAFERWRKEKVKEKLAAKATERIAKVRRVPKVNAELAKKLESDARKRPRLVCGAHAALCCHAHTT